MAEPIDPQDVADPVPPQDDADASRSTRTATERVGIAMGVGWAAVAALIAAHFAGLLG